MLANQGPPSRIDHVHRCRCRTESKKAAHGVSTVGEFEAGRFRIRYQGARQRAYDLRRGIGTPGVFVQPWTSRQPACGAAAGSRDHAASRAAAPAGSRADTATAASSTAGRACGAAATAAGERACPTATGRRASGRDACRRPARVAIGGARAGSAADRRRQVVLAKLDRDERHERANAGAANRRRRVATEHDIRCGPSTAAATRAA